ncbi:MAG: hypothetical protein IPH84_09015 [Bacteroidales bacterium]|nr:hypothetical protein [Bacteroidales bacterium]
MRNRFVFLVLMVCCLQLLLNAQSPSAQTLDSLSKEISKISNALQNLEKIKISGYIQAQYQWADTLGSRSFNGGDFPKTSAQRFMVRRGYFKLAYSGLNASYVLQFNVNEKGFSVRDAYFNLKEPWLKSFMLTGGIFYRPFGCELTYPTNQRETPELARVTQTLFPGERDLGAAVTFQAPRESALHPLKIDAGLFAGNGTSAETDDKLDFIGRIGWEDVISKGKLIYSGGFSFYNGSIYQSKKQVYQMESVNEIPLFTQVLTDTIPGNYQKRQYLGFDASIAWEHLLGKTRLRFDYMTGIQPGADTSSMSPTEKIGAPIYNRDFQGIVIYFIHNFPGSIHSFVIKYDSYDPNKGVSGDQIGLASIVGKTTNATDLSYTTWGFGYFADINKNLRLTAYYDLVRNEKSKYLSKYSGDVKDNIFTLRVQYKF